MTRLRTAVLAVVCVLAFFAGCVCMAVLVMWALLWPFEALARVLGVS